MPLSEVEGTHYRSEGGRLEQGAIFRDVSFVQVLEGADGEIATAQRDVAYCVLLSQDCDLLQDFTARADPAAGHDKHIDSLLFCPAYPALTVKLGTHREAES